MTEPPTRTGGRRNGNCWAATRATSPLVTFLTVPDSVALAWLPPWYTTYTSPVTGASADLTATGENSGAGPAPDRMSGTATAPASTTAAAAAARPVRRLRARVAWPGSPPGLVVLVPRCGCGESAAAVGRSARPGGTATAWVAGCSGGGAAAGA